ncbi:hypothetical protein ANOBCDAF_00193 [Pleomorphomonas sp. T1.2MG-36]|nr:hypothetical protein ANOBCDAF_00193 [Pleomorphomonas sp. T1.2MG-36]
MPKLMKKRIWVLFYFAIKRRNCDIYLVSDGQSTKTWIFIKRLSCYFVDFN